jgi:hypothetical protein
LKLQESTNSLKGKQKAVLEAGDSDDPDVNMEDLSNAVDAVEESAPVPNPMPSYESISTIRAKLHARIDNLRRERGATAGEPGSRDELLEEQRRKRGLLREKRRQATRERKRREEAGKQKNSGVQEREKGSQAKVSSISYSHVFASYS